MTPADRELSLYAKIEKLEKALAIAKTALQSLNDYQFSVGDRTGVLVKQHCKTALEQIEKELG